MLSTIPMYFIHIHQISIYKKTQETNKYTMVKTKGILYSININTKKKNNICENLDLIKTYTLIHIQ